MGSSRTPLENDLEKSVSRSLEALEKVSSSLPLTPGRRGTIVLGFSHLVLRIPPCVVRDNRVEAIWAKNDGAVLLGRLSFDKKENDMLMSGVVKSMAERVLEDELKELGEIVSRLLRMGVSECRLKQVVDEAAVEEVMRS